MILFLQNQLRVPLFEATCLYLQYAVCITLILALSLFIEHVLRVMLHSSDSYLYAL